MVPAIDQRVGEQDDEPELTLEIVTALAPFDPAAEEVDGRSQVPDSSVGPAERVGRRRIAQFGIELECVLEPDDRLVCLPAPEGDLAQAGLRARRESRVTGSSLNFGKPASASSVLSSRSAIDASRSFSSASASGRSPPLASHCSLTPTAAASRRTTWRDGARAPDSILDM